MFIYDYKKLKGAIREEFETQAAFAAAMGMTESTLSLKLNNKAEWTQDEITLSLSLLHKPLQYVEDYFFTHEV